MMRRILKASPCLLLAVLACAGGGTYYVSPGGDDGAAGSKAKPWRTIQQGINNLGPGDILLVEGGAYAEKLLIRDKRGGPGEAIEIRNAPGARPVIDQSGVGSPAAEISNCTFLTLSGFEMKNAPDNCLVVKSSSHLTVENLLVHHFLRYGISVDSGYDISIRHNELYGEKEGERERIGLVGVRLAGRDVHHNRVEYNRMYNLFQHQENSDASQIVAGAHHNLWTHNYMGAACDDGMDMIGGAHENIIEYNVFCHAGFDYTGTYSTHPQSNGRGFKTNYDSYDNVIRHNVAYANRTAGFSDEDAGIGNVFYNNTSFGNGENGFTAFNDGIFVNNVSCAEATNFPQKWADLNRVGAVSDAMAWFVNPSGFDFHLKPDSPLIDAGRAPISGDIRSTEFSGKAPDIGAFEFGAAETGEVSGLLPAGP